jgi:hypothetical protein
MRQPQAYHAHFETRIRGAAVQKETPSATPNLALIWGDTVDLKHLGAAIIIGVTLGFAFYRGGLFIIETQFSQLPVNLHKSIALPAGIAGCLPAAVISAECFPPKRIMSEQSFSNEDRERVLRELQIDPDREAEEMNTMPPFIIKEMEDLQLADVFRKSNGEKGTRHGNRIAQ